MALVTKIVEIVDGKIVEATEKLNANLLAIKSNTGLSVNSSGELVVNLTEHVTKNELDTAIAEAQLQGQEVDLSIKQDKLATISTTTVTPKISNYLPLYTLNDSSEYVLCNPDIWVKVDDYYIPGYSASTLGK